MTPPDWFVAALAQIPEHGSTLVEGAQIRFRSWGEADAPGILLIHGGAANGAWWDHIAPLLEGHRVVAIDLSGHGLSDWRPTYTLGAWREEVIAVIREAGFEAPPLVVGHSMGGFIAHAVARAFPDELAGAVVVDSPFPSEGEAQMLRATRRALPRNIYPDRETMLARFRLLPAAEVSAPYILRHIAEESVIQLNDGWSWRFDPLFFDHDWVTVTELTPITGCPIVIVRGDRGMVVSSAADAVATAVGSSGGVITIADSGHHVPVDQPIALSVLIAAFAAAWCVTERTGRRFAPLNEQGGS